MTTPLAAGTDALNRQPKTMSELVVFVWCTSTASTFEPFFNLPGAIVTTPFSSTALPTVADVLVVKLTAPPGMRERPTSEPLR